MNPTPPNDKPFSPAPDDKSYIAEQYRALEAENTAKASRIEKLETDNAGARDEQLRLLNRIAKLERVAEAARKVIRLSDRKHVAWDEAKQALSELEKTE